MNLDQLEPPEQAVRELLAQATTDLTLPVDLAGSAWKRGRRRRRLVAATGAVAASVAAGAVGAAAFTFAAHATGGGHHDGRTSVAASQPPTPSADGSASTCVPSRSRWAAEDPRLAALCLTAPVDGYEWDSPPSGDMSPSSFVAGQGEHLTRTWSLRQAPATRSTDGSGIVNVTPTGPEITIIVARAGAFPTTPAGVSAAHLLTVIGTANVRGMTATVARDSDNARHLLLTVNGFDIELAGFNYPHPAEPPSLATLSDVANRLRGL